jgi:hypothetical protein
VNLDNAGQPTRGPVCLYVFPDYSPEQKYHAVQYAASANFRIFFVSPQPNCSMLAERGTVDARKKASALRRFRSYYGTRPGYAAGHVPDSSFAFGLNEDPAVWATTPPGYNRYFPPIWLQMDGLVNSDLGWQQQLYSNGYQATVFIAIDLATGLPYPPVRYRGDWNWIQNPSNPCPYGS